ncbi:MAG: hypothetical protein Q9165_006802 [Trypethelium subeluteriae]
MESDASSFELVDTKFSSLSWVTRLSRTRVSSVDSIGLSGASSFHLQGLNDVLKTIQKLQLPRCSDGEVERAEVVGQGETYTVERCIVAKRVLAIKTLKLGNVSNDTTKFLRRLNSVLLELRIMHHKPLHAHPNILNLVAYGWSDQQNHILPYILVEYSPCGTFRDYLRSNNLTLRSKEILLGDVALGTAALHCASIVHGDLKLENVLIFHSWDRPSGVIGKLADFGHSLLLLATNKDHPPPRYDGTPLYNAPEVSEQRSNRLGCSQLYKCDTWAFGLLAWEALLDGDRYIGHLPTRKEAIKTSGTALSSDEFSSILQLAKNAVPLTPGTMQGPFFRGLFNLTLKLDAESRTANLAALPVVSQWHDDSSAKLDANLALHSGSSDWSFELFRLDGGFEISWNIQEQIFHDFERCNNSLNKQSRKAIESAWQLALCYFLELGTPQHLQLAADFAKKAQGCDELLTSLSTVLIPESLQNTWSINYYHSIVVSAFCTTPALARDTLISFKFGNIEAKQIRFPNYTVFSSWLSSNSEGLDLSTTSVWIDDLDKPLDVTDVLVLFRDLPLLTALGTKLSSKGRSNLDAAGFVPNSDQTPLVHAIRTGLVGAASALLDQGESPHARCIDGTNAFHWLFLLGDSVRDFAREKLMPYRDDPARHASSHTVNVLHKQWPLQLLGTPIAFAIASGSKDAVLALLELGANPNALVYRWGQFQESDHRSHWNSLHLAIKYHLPDILGVLLVIGCRAKKELRNATASGVTPLMQAIDFNDTAVVSALIDADPLLAEHILRDPQDEQKHTYPIHFSAQLASHRNTPSSIDILRILKESSQSSLHVVDSDRRSPLQLAVTGPYDCASQYILQEAPELLDSRDSGGKTALLISRSAINSEWLLSQGANIKAVDSEGRSALHWACLHDAIDVVRVLLKHQASTTCQSLMWGTPLHCAVLKKNREIIMALLQNGVAVNTRDYAGNTPFNMAARTSRKDIVQLLLQYGAEVTIANHLGETPLAAAIESGDFGVVQAIAPFVRADSIIKSLELETPLHMCARSGDAEMMALFLQQPATSMHLNRNIDGQSPFLLTAMHANVVAGRLLLDAGLADVHEKDAFGHTAFHLVLLGLWTTIESSKEQRLSFCSLLRDFDAPMGEKDHLGRTPWDSALLDFRDNAHNKSPASTEFLVFLLEYGGPRVCQISPDCAKTADVTYLLEQAFIQEDAPLCSALIRTHAVKETDLEDMVRRYKCSEPESDITVKEFASILSWCALNDNTTSQMTSRYLRMDVTTFRESAYGERFFAKRETKKEPDEE